MRKIIHSKFEIDLSKFQLVDQEQNSNMADTMFAKTTYPFEIDLDDELNVSLGFINEYTTRPESIYDVIYCHYDKIEKATLEIEEITSRRLSCVVVYGLEQFPSWDKKLSELPLQKFELPAGTSIYQHAQTIIPQTWPAVNYNFPQVHTDKINTEDDIWFAFEKIINNRKAGAFLENNVDLVEDITYNRNIMQPLPYLLHVLQKGCEAANCTLTGDILQDNFLKSQTIFADVDYYTTVAQESQSGIIMSEDFIQEGVRNGRYFHKYEKIFTITDPGKYRVVGDVDLYTIPAFPCYIKLYYRNQLLYNFVRSDNVPEVRHRGIDVVFETLVDLEPNEIRLEIYAVRTFEKLIATIDINPIRLHDTSGVAIPNILNKNEVDLQRAVPDMNFGELVNIMKNWFNYSFDVFGSIVVMNKIVDSSNYQEIIPFTQHEVKIVTRKFQKGISFLLKFSDVDTKDYDFVPVFHSRNSILNSNYLTDDKTNTIEINALPLPVLLRNEVQTAHAFENSGNKLYLVKYNGIFQGNNLAQDNATLLLPSVHELYWRKWFDYRINAIPYKWQFKAMALDVLKINSKSKIYAYQNNHLIKSIQRTEILPDIFEVEIETESF